MKKKKKNIRNGGERDWNRNGTWRGWTGERDIKMGHQFRLIYSFTSPLDSPHLAQSGMEVNTSVSVAAGEIDFTMQYSTK